MRSKIFFLPAFLFLLIHPAALAQFQPTGSDPASIRWHQIETPNFRIIYPSGSDSLARVYGLALEKYRIPLSLSSGFRTGESYRTRLPVILHGHSTVSNGSVAWAPKRMDIFTVPDPYRPTPVPWPTLLAIHEGRHASQMQFGRAHSLNIYHFLFGEMAAGAFAGIFPGRTLLEGDAVTAETALTRSGRGRQADFLNYLMPAFDCGDWRDWWQWTYGSQKRYAPDFYRAGYLLVSGTRVFFDDPLFTKRYFERVSRKGSVLSLQKTVKEASGKSFKASFRQIEEAYRDIWNREAALRAPFMPARQVTARPKRHTGYDKVIPAPDGHLLAVKDGLSAPASLVRIASDGTEKRIRSFSGSTGRLFHDGRFGRIYWTETVPARRWTLRTYSDIRYADLSRPRRVRSLTTRGRYFNSAPSPDGEWLSATEYPVEGGSRLVLISASDGSAGQSFTAPDSLQFVESAWIGNRRFVSGLSEGGFGLYEITGRSADGKALLRKLAGPRPVTISHLDSRGGLLSFESDRTGVGELYALDPDSGELKQLTSTRYGLADAHFNEAGDTLYYCSVASSDKPETYRQGTMIYATATADLFPKTVSLDEIHEYAVADALSRQEEELRTRQVPPAAPEEGNTPLSEPKNYAKLRLPRLHSWAPVFFNYDRIDDLSMDHYYRTASPGATGIFQNNLGTGFGFAGISVHEDPLDKSAWRPSFFLNYTCTGLPAVIQTTFNFNERESVDYQRVHLKKGSTPHQGHLMYHRRKAVQGKPWVEWTLNTYIPFNFSSGGLSRGLVPRIGYSISNDRLTDGVSMEYEDEKGKPLPELTTVEGAGRTAPYRSLKMSLRGYVMRKTAPSQMFPSLGFGAELGVKAFPGHIRSFPTMASLYLYGYLPGITRNQGIKLTASVQGRLIRDRGKHPVRFEPNVISTVPRGLAGTRLATMTEMTGKDRLKATLDYAIPMLPVDGSFLSPAAYIRNFELVPFADFSWIAWNGSPEMGLNPTFAGGSRIVSCGADFCVRLGNFLWLPYDTRIGVRYACNFWNNLERIPVGDIGHHHLSFLFSVDL